MDFFVIDIVIIDMIASSHSEHFGCALFCPGFGPPIAKVAIFLGRKSRDDGVQIHNYPLSSSSSSSSCRVDGPRARDIKTVSRLPLGVRRDACASCGASSCSFSLEGSGKIIRPIIYINVMFGDTLKTHKIAGEARR